MLRPRPAGTRVTTAMATTTARPITGRLATAMERPWRSTLHRPFTPIPNTGPAILMLNLTTTTTIPGSISSEGPAGTTAGPTTASPWGGVPAAAFATTARRGCTRATHPGPTARIFRAPSSALGVAGSRRPV